MTTLTIEVASQDGLNARILHAAARGEPCGPGYVFATEADLLATLSPNRWAIVKALTGALAAGQESEAKAGSPG